VTSEMPGVVLRVLANAGDAISAGESVLVIEAMKMEVHISAPVSGTVAEVAVAVGDQVTTGQEVATIA
ncbi:MAG: biotin/lipoyl-containing protein, partial [Planctomycetota bacterium]